jgi:hypothetical protein
MLRIDIYYLWLCIHFMQLSQRIWCLQFGLRVQYFRNWKIFRDRPTYIVDSTVHKPTLRKFVQVGMPFRTGQLSINYRNLYA